MHAKCALSFSYLLHAGASLELLHWGGGGGGGGGGVEAKGTDEPLCVPTTFCIRGGGGVGLSYRDPKTYMF